MFAVLGTFISDRILLGRERGMRYCEQIHSAAVVLTSRVLCPAAGYYTTLPYFLSKIMCDFIPLRMLPPVVFGVVVYWMIGLHNQPERFAMFVVVLVEINLAVCAGCDESTTLTGPSHTAYLLVVTVHPMFLRTSVRARLRASSSLHWSSLSVWPTSSHPCTSSSRCCLEVCSSAPAAAHSAACATRPSLITAGRL